MERATSCASAKIPVRSFPADVRLVWRGGGSAVQPHRRQGDAGAHARRHRAPRPRRLRGAHRPGGRPRASPAEHHRRGRRRAADVRRGQPGRDRLQRRGLQPPGAQGRARGTGARLPHAVRHRDRAQAVRDRWTRSAEAAARDVRLRDLGRAHAVAAARAGPLRRQAALLSPRGRRHARLRFGDQSAARVGDPARVAARGGAARLPGEPRDLRRRDAVRRRPSRARGTHAAVARRSGVDRALLGPQLRRDGRCRARQRFRRGPRRRVPRPLPGGRQAALDVGRPARDVPFRRHRLGGDHGDDEPARARADQDFLGGVRRAGGERARVCAAGGEALRHGPSRGRRLGAGLPERRAAARLARGRADGAPLERGAVLRVEACVGAREGRAHRRGQRRDAGRLQPVPRHAVEPALRGAIRAGAPGRRAPRDRERCRCARAGKALARAASAHVPLRAGDARRPVLRQLRRVRAAAASLAARPGAA